MIARVPAHKAILAGSSNVFHAMFYGSMRETGDVHISDASEAEFKEFLQYFYLAEVTLTETNVANVWYLGEKYNVERCIANCMQYLKHSLDDENVCSQLQISANDISNNTR